MTVKLMFIIIPKGESLLFPISISTFWLILNITISFTLSKIIIFIYQCQDFFFNIWKYLEWGILPLRENGK